MLRFPHVFIPPQIFLGAALLALTVLLVVGHAHAADPLPTNNDPSRQIRFRTADQANAHRERLIRFIWTDGVPTVVLPTVTRHVHDETAAADLAEISHDRVEHIDRLTINVSGWRYFAKTYLLYPKNNNNADRLVIVHAGHSYALEDGVAETANYLLAAGFTVAMSHMPLMSWNTDHDGVLNDGTVFDLGSNHDDLFEALADRIDGGTFRLFLEPVVQTINWFIQTSPDPADISMIGLSGGGWLTHLMAAVDTRIRVSVPVAGSAPLYVRNRDASSLGDAEQVYAPLYAEDIADDGNGGGVATWLEIYALGAYGKDRWQTMVTIERDPCCFGGRFADSFKDIVTNKVSQELGQGNWAHVLDSSHQKHEISEWIRSEVISSLLGISENHQSNVWPEPTRRGPMRTR